MRPRDDVADLARSTAIWIAVVLWLAWGYAIQNPPTDRYDDAARSAFVLVLSLLVPALTGVTVAAWVVVLRQRRR